MECRWCRSAWEDDGVRPVTGEWMPLGTVMGSAVGVVELPTGATSAGGSDGVDDSHQPLVGEHGSSTGW